LKGKAIWDPVGKTKSRREVGGREACKGEEMWTQNGKQNQAGRFGWEGFRRIACLDPKMESKSRRGVGRGRLEKEIKFGPKANQGGGSWRRLEKENSLEPKRGNRIKARGWGREACEGVEICTQSGKQNQGGQLGGKA
jgi:hypothetical protein